MGLLETIQSPSDLRALHAEQLDELAAEIRGFLIARSRAPAATSAPTSASSS